MDPLLYQLLEPIVVLSFLSLLTYGAKTMIWGKELQKRRWVLFQKHSKIQENYMGLNKRSLERFLKHKNDILSHPKGWSI